MKTLLTVPAFIPLLAGLTLAGMDGHFGWSAERRGEHAHEIRLHNHYPFPVHEVLCFPAPPGWLKENTVGCVVRPEGPASARPESVPTLQLGEAEEGTRACWMEVELSAGESRRYRLRPLDEPLPPVEGTQATVVDAFASGLPATLQLASGMRIALFDLILIEASENLEALESEDQSEQRRLLDSALVRHSATGPRKPIFTLTSENSHPLMYVRTFTGTMEEKNRYRLEVVYTTYAWGVTDVEIRLTNIECRTKEGYLALAKFVPATESERATIRWKGERLPVEWKGMSPARSARSHHFSRDVSWLALTDAKGRRGRALLADFVPGMTRLINETYVPVNDFLINERVIGSDTGWCMLSEIARKNDITRYVPGAYVLPASGETMVLRFRSLTLDENPVEQTDHTFIAWAGYRRAVQEKEHTQVDFGVSGVSFGTSYFPHSTLGENFEYWKTAGLQGERWWPVLQTGWRMAKEDLRRDMRIANALGLEWIRIHHFDAPEGQAGYLASPEGRWLWEYLGTMVHLARECGLRIYLDFHLSPDDAARVAREYGDIVGYYEIENEVLLQGIPRNRLADWKLVRDAIRRERPDAPVLLTAGPMFLSLYERLEQLGLEVDAVGQHSYCDGRQAPRYFSDIALALGGYASRRDRIPVNSEINWRFITRETEESQAEHFGQIYECFLSQRAVPLMLQFQFNETFCLPPRSRGALRHYEVLRVDRTPKPQALVYRDLVRKYSALQRPIRNLEITMPNREIVPGETLLLPVTFRNLSERPLRLVSRLCLPEGFHCKGKSKVSLTLEPWESKTVQRKITAATALCPGFYHLFEEVRFREADDVLFGWGYVAHRRSPRLELETPPLQGVQYAGGIEVLESLDLSSLDAVIFGLEAPALEVDWALYLYHSLRCASGADIQRYSDSDAEAEALLKRTNVLLVGNAASNRWVKAVENSSRLDVSALPTGTGAIEILNNPFAKGKKILLVSGHDETGVQKAASDFLYRYWRYAKDAITFRDGLDSFTSDSGLALEKTLRAGAMLAIEGPAQAEVGQPILLRVLEMTEPPGPAAGVALRAVRQTQEILLGQTSASGEIRHTFTRRGTYEIGVVADAQGLQASRLTITVK